MGQLCPGNRKALDSENNDLYDPSELRHKYQLRDEDDLQPDLDVSRLFKEQNMNLGKEIGKLFVSVEEAKVLENNCNFLFERCFQVAVNLVGHKESMRSNRVAGGLVPKFDKEVMQLRVFENQVALLEVALLSLPEKGQDIKVGYQLINIHSIVHEEVHLKGIVPLFYRSMRAVNLKLSIQFFSNQESVNENNYATFGQQESTWTSLC